MNNEINTNLIKKILITVIVICICGAAAFGGFNIYKSMTKETYYLLGDLSFDKSIYGYDIRNGNYLNLEDYDDDYYSLSYYVQNKAKAPNGVDKSEWRDMLTALDYYEEELPENPKNGDTVTVHCYMLYGAEEAYDDLNPMEAFEKKYNCNLMLTDDVTWDGDASVEVKLEGWPTNYKRGAEILSEKKAVLDAFVHKSSNTAKNSFNDGTVIEHTLYYATSSSDADSENAYVIDIVKVKYDSYFDGTKIGYKATYIGPFNTHMEIADFEGEHDYYSSVFHTLRDAESDSELIDQLENEEFSDVYKYNLEKINY